MGEVDGVPYRHDLASGIVVVGSGLVSNDRRDTFKLKAGRTLEAQLRERPKFKDLAAAAAAAAGAGEAAGEAADAAAGKAAGEAAADAAADAAFDAAGDAAGEAVGETVGEAVAPRP